MSIRKLVVMYFVTYGLYQVYWFYENWKSVQAQTGVRLRPFWRAVFSPLWCHTLFATIETRAVDCGVEPRFDATAVAWVWWTLFAAGFLPGNFKLIRVLSLVPLILVQRTCNDLNRAAALKNGVNDRFSTLNIIGVLLGGGLLALRCIQAFHQ